jgi:hypothetical protein
MQFSLVQLLQSPSQKNPALRATVPQRDIFISCSFHWSQLQQVQQLLSSQQIGMHISIFVFITELLVQISAQPQPQPVVHTTTLQRIFSSKFDT